MGTLQLPSISLQGTTELGLGLEAASRNGQAGTGSSRTPSPTTALGGGRVETFCQGQP